MDLKSRAKKIMQALHHESIRQAQLNAMRRTVAQGVVLGLAAILAWGLALIVTNSSAAAILMIIAFGTICALLATATSQLTLYFTLPRSES